jgi:GTP-binding protein HflX
VLSSALTCACGRRRPDAPAAASQFPDGRTAGGGGGLARAIDLDVQAQVMRRSRQIRPATYLGKGKVEEIDGLIRANNADLVVMDCALSPVQQRNLEKEWNAKVLDRTGLILEIFGARAKTRKARCRSNWRI